MSHRSLTDTPPPYGLKTGIGRYRFDIAVLKQTDDKVCIAKILSYKEKVKTQNAVQVCYGKPYMFDWTGAVRITKKVIHYIFVSIGGFQCRNHVLRSHKEGKPEKERQPEDCDFGFDYIEEKGPRDNTRKKQSSWVTVAINRPDSPLYKWGLPIISFNRAPC